MHQFPYEAPTEPPSVTPPRSDTTLKGESHFPKEPLDTDPHFQAPSMFGISLIRFGWPLLASLMVLAVVVLFNPLESAGPNPLLKLALGPWVALIVQVTLIFVSLLVLEFLFGLTGSPLFLWVVALGVVGIFFGVLYFFDRNFFDPTYQISLGPLPQIFMTIKSYLASPF